MLRFELDDSNLGKYEPSAVELEAKEKMFLDFDLGMRLDLVNRFKYDKPEQKPQETGFNFVDEFLLSD